MNKIEIIQKELLNAIKANPLNSNLYNDYAMFLYRYKNDYKTASKLLEKALRLNPQNKIFRYNYNKIAYRTEIRFEHYHNFLVLLIIGIMFYLIWYGYNNFLNMCSLFILTQIIMNYQKNVYSRKKLELY